MKSYLRRGVYVKQVRAYPTAIARVETSVVGFVGKTEHVHKVVFDTVTFNNDALLNIPTKITSWAEYVDMYGDYDKKYSPYLALSVKGFFDNGGSACYIVRVPEQATTADFIGSVINTHANNMNIKQGLAALESVDINIICIPGVTDIAVQQAMIKHCEKFKYRFCILDSVQTADVNWFKARRSQLDTSYAALYYPWLKLTTDSGEVVVMPPSGFIAGVYAQMDATRGVHKAPANIGINGAIDLLVNIDNSLQDILNPLHINCLRSFPNRGRSGGSSNIVIWGARTLSRDPQWKYLNVRRLCSFIEESIYKGTLWAVFEPNNETLWAAIKLLIDNFLMQLWKEGMLQGAKVDEAFFVQCDRSTNSIADIENGRVRINIGLAPLKPAEFIVINILQNTRK